MHVVAISSWKEDTAELVQALAHTLQMTVYEARPRMYGKGPAVVASFADRDMALALTAELHRIGFTTMIVDSSEAYNRAGHSIIRSFRFNNVSISIETGEGKREEIPYDEVDLLLQGTRIVGTSVTKKVTERKFSIGKTILSGGIPMTSTVEHQETVSNETRGKILFLYAGSRPPLVFCQNGMTFDGFGTSLKLSRDLNFAHLVSELRRFCPEAAYDDRLLNRAGQVRVLGPTLNPESSFDLAAEVLARSLGISKEPSLDTGYGK